MRPGLPPVPERFHGARWRGDHCRYVLAAGAIGQVAAKAVLAEDGIEVVWLVWESCRQNC
jgi:hypothetical protein